MNGNLNAAHGPGAGPLAAAMVGAGQLARMTAGASHILGDPEDVAVLRALADGCDALTFDHEHVAPDAVRSLESDGFVVAPSSSALLHAQDKLHARTSLRRRGFPVPDFTHARTVSEIERFAAEHSWPLVGKAPPNIQAWVIGGNPPTFARDVAPLYSEGPLMTLQLVSPTWPEETK